MNTSKLLQALHSKTIWTMVIGLAFNFLVPQLNLNPAVRDLVNTILVAITAYLHINPATPGQYSPAGVTPPTTPVVVDTTTNKIVPSTNTPVVDTATVTITPTVTEPTVLTPPVPPV